MSIRRIGNRYQVRIRVGRGQRVERTLPPGATRDDARALEATLKRARIDVAVGRQPARLIDDAITQWVNSEAKTLKSYERDIKYRLDIIRTHTTGKSLDQIVEVAEHIKKEGHRQKLTAATINRYVALLRRIGNLAEQWGWTDKPLGRRVKLLAEVSERHVYLTPEQVNAIAAKALPEVADMIKFAALSGLRLSEMLALRPDQIRDGLLLLDASTKSGKPRAIPLPPEAIRIAKRRLPWPVARSRLHVRFKEARIAAGLPDVHWHDLRHTYASWLVQAGQPLTAVRDLLGHSSLSVTNRYSHLAPKHLIAAVATLPKLRKSR